jgi:hypothetical protein
MLKEKYCASPLPLDEDLLDRLFEDFSFKDLDENKPSGSIRIRVETIDYFLRCYREDIIKRRGLETDIEAQLAAFEQSLRSQQLEAAAGD